MSENQTLDFGVRPRCCHCRLVLELTDIAMTLQNKFQSDFYTSEEMSKFKKPLASPHDMRAWKYVSEQMQCFTLQSYLSQGQPRNLRRRAEQRSPRLATLLCSDETVGGFEIPSRC